MSDQPSPTCATCRFSIHIHGPQLDCLRYPKREAKHPDYWCGEHKPAAKRETAATDVNSLREKLLDAEADVRNLSAMNGALRDQVEKAQESIRRLLQEREPAATATPEKPDAGAQALELLREAGKLDDKHVFEWVKVNPSWPERVRDLLRESGEGAK